MPQLGEIWFSLSLKTQDFTSGFNKAQSALKGFSKEMGKLSTEFRAVASLAGYAGTRLTGAFAAAFAASKKDIPQVDYALRDLNKSFQEMSKSVAIAALPALKDIGDGMVRFSNVVKDINSRYPGLISGTLKFGVALMGINMAFSAMAKGWTILKLMSTLGFWKEKIILTAIAVAIYAVLKATGLWDKAVQALKQSWNSFSGDLEQNVPKIDRFVRGVRDEFKDLATNLEQFGHSVAQSLENAFSDTLFDSITGRIHGLRSIIKSFGEDVLRAFTKNISNAFLGGLLGSEKGPGFLGGGGLGAFATSFGGMFGGIGRAFGGMNKNPAEQATRGLAQQVTRTTTNLQAFGAKKDEVIRNLGVFKETLTNVGNGIKQIAQGIGNVTTQLLSLIVQGWGQAINTVISFANSLFGMLGGKGGGFMGGVFGSLLGAVVGSVLPGIGTAIGGKIGGGAPGSITMGLGAMAPHLQEGGIVRKPTFALMGEKGPEAVVPLDKAGSLGGVIVNFTQPIFLENDAAMDRFVRKLSPALIRASGRRTGGTSIAL